MRVSKVIVSEQRVLGDHPATESLDLSVLTREFAQVLRATSAACETSRDRSGAAQETEERHPGDVRHRVNRASSSDAAQSTS